MTLISSSEIGSPDLVWKNGETPGATPTLPTLGVRQQEPNQKTYQGFALERDPKDQELFQLKNIKTGEYLPGRFKGRRYMEAEIDAYRFQEERDNKLRSYGLDNGQN